MTAPDIPPEFTETAPPMPRISDREAFLADAVNSFLSATGPEGAAFVFLKSAFQRYREMEPGVIHITEAFARTPDEVDTLKAALAAEQQLSAERLRLCETLNGHLLWARQLVDREISLSEKAVASAEKATRDKDYMAKELDRIAELAARLHAQLRTATASRDDVWFWQPKAPAENDAESLSCPVVMSADTLREFLDAQKRLEELLAAAPETPPTQGP